MARSVQGRVSSEKKISLGNTKYPGRDIVVTMGQPKGLMHNRIYLVDGRLYQVMVLGTKAFTESREARQVLDSFALTRK